MISRVPASTLPAGSARLEKISRIKMDWEHPNATDGIMPCDTTNEYGLNEAYIFEDIKVKLANLDNTIAYSILPKSGKMIFSQRLPPINDCEFLIYRVTRTSGAQPDFPLWVLLMTNWQGVVLYDAVISRVDCLENDYYIKFLFHIDSDYVLTVKTYARYDEDEEMEESISYDPNYLYEISTIKYKLSINGIERTE